MRSSLLRFALPFALLVGACRSDSEPAETPRVVAPRSAVLAATTERPPTPPPTTAPAPQGPRGEVVLVVLGKPFPKDLIDRIEQDLRDELQVEVTRHERIPLPKEAYYRKRKRYRADEILDHLLTLDPDAPQTTRFLGLTTVDISTTKGDVYDWGIFGLGRMPGQAAVISNYRLKRGAKNREHLRFRVSSTAVHEVGHTFGLDHCPEERCVMQDAQGGIKNTDTGTGRLGPSCRAKLDADFPRRADP